MGYTALYRKFRPDTFDSVCGQDHIVTTLKNQVKAGRIGHAFLFCGTRGIGKTTVAKILARTVNCESPVDGGPCGECAMCKAIAAGTSMNVIEIDAASNNGVDNIREVIEEVKYSPTEGKYKVYIIDEVHMLSIGAFNALLKTLEEPPAYVIFILATTEPQKIPITILSRCQRYDFKRATATDVAARLRTLVDAEGIEAEDKALRYIGTVADGSFRDGISLLDQCISFYLGEALTYDKALEVLGTVDVSVFGGLMKAIRTGDTAAALKVIDDCINKGREITLFVSDFTWYLRNLMVSRATGHPEECLDIPTDFMSDFINEVNANSAEEIARLIRIMSKLSNDLRYAAQKRVLVEVAIIKMCHPESEGDLEAVNSRISRIEDRIESGDINVSARAGNAVGNAVTEPAREEKPVEYTKAIPEEVQEIVQNWPSVIKNCRGMVREALQMAKVSITDNDKILLVVQDKLDAMCLCNNEGNTSQAVADAIAEITQKIVEVQVKCVENQKQANEYPDLQKIVKMKIKFED